MTCKPSGSATRRAALGLFAGAGAAGVTAAASAARQNARPITADTIQSAESLLRVDYTDAEREQMLDGIQGWVGRAEALRAMEMMMQRFENLDAIIGPNFAGNMLLMTNYTGHPQLAFRSGFTQQPTRTIFGAAADESGATFEMPYATSLWSPLLREDTVLALGAAIEHRLGVAETRPPQFS